MNAITENILREAADAFAFDRTTGEISRYGEGHINDTFVVWASDKCKRYIMQRINTDTFKNPKELMENVCHVTGFLRKAILEKGGDPERETLNVIPTKEGKPFYTDSDGGTWRAYIFVEDAQRYCSSRRWLYVVAVCLQCKIWPVPLLFHCPWLGVHGELPVAWYRPHVPLNVHRLCIQQCGLLHADVHCSY